MNDGITKQFYKRLALFEFVCFKLEARERFNKMIEELLEAEDREKEDK